MGGYGLSASVESESLPVSNDQRTATISMKLSNIFILIILCNTPAQQVKPASPLGWHYGTYGLHTLIPASRTKPALDAVLAKECLLLRKRKSEQKAQMVQANFLVDLSEIARQEDNIRAGIRVLRQAQPKIDTGFSTCPTCHFEYLHHNPN